MLYLITGEWIDDPTVSLQEYVTLWEQMIRPSLEALSNTADGKKREECLLVKERDVRYLMFLLMKK
jgi:hypothetical protein